MKLESVLRNGIKWRLNKVSPLSCKVNSKSLRWPKYLNIKLCDRFGIKSVSIYNSKWCKVLLWLRHWRSNSKHKSQNNICHIVSK